MADVAPGIITFGLGGNHSNMIIGHPFNLGFLQVVVTVGRGDSGGGIPLAPGEIAKLYKPVNEDPWLTLQDFPDGSRFPVTINLSFREHKVERNYIVSKKRAGMIVKVLKFARKIQDTASIVISNFKKKTLQVMKVLNIRKK